jgi:hypothetical protein
VAGHRECLHVREGEFSVAVHRWIKRSPGLNERTFQSGSRAELWCRGKVPVRRHDLCEDKIGDMRVSRGHRGCLMLAHATARALKYPEKWPCRTVSLCARCN